MNINKILTISNSEDDVNKIMFNSWVTDKMHLFTFRYVIDDNNSYFYIRNALKYATRMKCEHIEQNIKENTVSVKPIK